MRSTIISDTSCLILLEKIGELEVLHQLFGTITTTQEVANEYGLPLPHWFEIKHPIDKDYLKIIEQTVDKGEASAIALAVETENSLLIIDEQKGRKLAKELGLPFTGTMGILLEAKFAGILPSIKPILLRIRSTNFRISEQLELLLLKKAGEV